MHWCVLLLFLLWDAVAYNRTMLAAAALQPCPALPFALPSRKIDLQMEVCGMALTHLV